MDKFKTEVFNEIQGLVMPHPWKIPTAEQIKTKPVSK